MRGLYAIEFLSHPLHCTALQLGCFLFVELLSKSKRVPLNVFLLLASELDSFDSRFLKSSFFLFFLLVSIWYCSLRLVLGSLKEGWRSLLTCVLLD